MSILLERTKSQQAPAQQAQGTPISARVAGTLATWNVQQGQQVAQWATVAILHDGVGPVEASAPYAGRVLALVAQQGAPVQIGDVLCYIDAPEAPQTRPTTRTTNHTAPSGKTPQPATEPAREPSAAAPLVQDEPAIVVDQQPARRSTVAPVLEIIEIEPEPMPTPRKRERRPVIVRKTCRPTNKQEQAILKLMDELAKDGFDFSEGELHRVMFDWLLSLSRRELVALAEANRDKEQAGRYGWGARPQG